MLNNEEKISVVDSRIRSLEYNKYNLQLSLIEENAVSIPNEDSIESIENQMNLVNLKISALQSEKSELTEEE
jgi:hypothetical protein